MSLLGRLVLNDGTCFLVGDYDPSATGADTPQGSLFLRKGATNQVWLKTGAAATAWTRQLTTADVPVAALQSVAIAFTDGDTARRVTVTDAAAGVASIILCSVMRPTTADGDDKGYLYTAAVITRAVGSFDVLIAAHDLSGMDCTDDPPNETVTLTYLLG
jgi:hypothetical protein